MQTSNRLQRAHDEIHRLTAENQELRRASIMFGNLAERLNEQLHAERQLKWAPSVHLQGIASERLNQAARPGDSAGPLRVRRRNSPIAENDRASVSASHRTPGI